MNIRQTTDKFLYYFNDPHCRYVSFEHYHRRCGEFIRKEKPTDSELDELRYVFLGKRKSLIFTQCEKRDKWTTDDFVSFVQTASVSAHLL